MRMSNMAKISVSIMLGLQSLSVMAQGIQAQQLPFHPINNHISMVDKHIKMLIANWDDKQKNG